MAKRPDDDEYVPSQQGQEANRQGNLLRRAVEEEFRARRVQVMRFSENTGNSDLFANKRLVKDYPAMCIYGVERESAFVYVQEHVLRVRIECIAQHGSGSVDEKFPFKILNAQMAPEHNVWIIADGDGFKDEALAWMRSQARASAPKKISVLTLLQAKQRIKILVDRGEP